MYRQFEIPFNHTDELLQFLNRNKNLLLRYVKHILVAPFIDDYKSTRHNEAIKPVNRTEYEHQIMQLQSMGYKIALLFNMPGNVDESMIEYYTKLNIDTFIINNDEVAISLHKLGFTTISSITKRMQLNDIISRDLSMYDYIVLDYTFNASLDRIKKLPKTNKYILMVNTLCDYTCDFYSHWQEKANYQCPRLINGDKNTTMIKPQDYNLFDEYISIYKLQGREYSTKIIVEHIMYYILQKYKYGDNRPTPDGYYYRYKGE